MNVPYQDGKILYSLVLKGHFKNILEIGTSTGHSTIWLAWAALSPIPVPISQHPFRSDQEKKATLVPLSRFDVYLSCYDLVTPFCPMPLPPLCLGRTGGGVRRRTPGVPPRRTH